ncbi:MAG: 3-phosphoshikimate 1-carboxyvinyltransferase [SAR324 cluster bacterium]|nr:3-phosphoshikimate 1-carboxyvinyltransferase [SAR324 cluster bacterium]
MYKYPKILEIPLFTGPAKLKETIRIPGSKSISNRVLLIAALAKGSTKIEGLLSSVDTEKMADALGNLGVEFKGDRPFTGAFEVVGCGGKFKACPEELYIENAGTAMRFLTAALTLGEGGYTLTGNAAMQKRPIKDLTEALKQIDIKITDAGGCPPVQIEAHGFAGGRIQIPGDKSSQYISALMIVAPYAQSDTIIEITGHLVSVTYVEMTKEIMEAFGATVGWDYKNQTITIKAGTGYKALSSYAVEADASSASYYFGLAAISSDVVYFDDAFEFTSQGDAGLYNILRSMSRVLQVVKGPNGTGAMFQRKFDGQLKAVEVDMNSMSDVAPTLAVVALFADGTTKIRNVGNMRIKECDRIQAVYNELTKLGASIWGLVGESNEFRIADPDGTMPPEVDGLAILGDPSCESFHGADLDTYDDHRMAMAFSLAGTKIKSVRIKDTDCVTKTFPNYWEVLKKFLPTLEV